MTADFLTELNKVIVALTDKQDAINASKQRQNDMLDACIATRKLPNPAMSGFKVQTVLYTGDDA